MNDFLTQSAVSAVVGGVLLFLAALGIYGVVGLMVATRIREIAVRVALRRRVRSSQVKGDDWGIALSRLEPLGYLVGSVIAMLVAIAASLAPARRAASVPPMVAMRSE